MCHCSKPEGIGRDTPDKQGDNCLQPASENYQQFLFSLKATFGGFVWKFRLEILFGNFVWMFVWIFHLEVSFGNIIWKFCLEISFANFVWIFVWIFVWKFRLEVSFGNFVWKTDRPTERLLEASGRSLKS